MCVACCSISARRHVHVGRPRADYVSAPAAPAAAAAGARVLVAGRSDARRASVGTASSLRSSFRTADDRGVVVDCRQRVV